MEDKVNAPAGAPIEMPEGEGNAAAQPAATAPGAKADDPIQPPADGAEGAPAGGENGGGGQGKGSPQPTVPDKYEFKLPEGFVLDEGSVAELTPLLKKLNVPQKEAQELVDFHFKEMARVDSERSAAHAALIKQWQDETRKDAEIGGQKLNENLSYANRFIAKFAGAEFISLMRETGLQHNADFLRFMVKAGRALAEDAFVNGSSGGAKPSTVSELGNLWFPESLGGKN